MRTGWALWLIVGAAAASLPGCYAPVPLHVGGDVVVTCAMAGSGAAVPRVIVVPFMVHGGHEHDVLEVQVLSGPTPVVRFPESSGVGWLGPTHGLALPVDLKTSTPDLEFIAFAADCWPAVAHENYAWMPTGIARRPYPGEDRAEVPTLPKGACGAATVRFYPRSHPLGADVARNLLAMNSLEAPGDELRYILNCRDQLIERIDKSPVLTDGDRRMIYRQLYDVALRLRPIYEQEHAREDLAVTAALLRERLVALCVAAGEAPPPEESDEAAWLLQIKADVAARGISAATPEWLPLAVDRNWTSCVDYLLEQGADRSVHWGQGTPVPLQVAMYGNNAAMVHRLLDAGADPNVIVNEPVFGAAGPLHSAVERRQLDVVQLLLDHGANVDGPPEGRTPLMVAVDTGYLAAARLLLDRGADTKARRYGGLTAMLIACERRGDGEQAAILELLLDRQADVGGADSNGATTLHRAIFSRQPHSVIQRLLERGAAVNHRDICGRTPLGYARKWDSPKEVIEALRSHGGKE
jgi:hypothetical protein